MRIGMPRIVVGLLVFPSAWVGMLAAGEAPAQDNSGLAFLSAMQDRTAAIIEENEKSVVAIARVRKVRPGEGFAPEFAPDPFGRPMSPRGTPQPTDPDFIPNQYCTGVVIDPGGLILTTYHSLGDPEANEYYVTTYDGKVYRARPDQPVRGADPRSDLAVLEIEAAGLRPIRFGDASTLKKGHFVIVLGNPYAIARDGQVSASWGMVSNLARKAGPEEPGRTGRSTLHHYGTLIQTDARLNLGTSGGVMLNLRGEMVGLTTSLAATAGYETPAGYAIPIDATFRRTIETLKQGREVEYGFLGIKTDNLTSREVHSGVRGMRVSFVYPGTPADHCGLQAGDVITAVNGKPIYDKDGLVLEVGRLPVEAEANLTVLRGQRQFEREALLAKYPVEGRKIVTNPPPRWRGMQVDYPSVARDDGRTIGGGSALFDGVLVTEVKEGSPCWKAGLRPGMRISQVADIPVRTPKQFRDIAFPKSGPLTLRLLDDQDKPTQRVVGPEE